MKTVYFVRHGESEGNASTIWQDKNSPLTEKGRAQATMLAERIATLPIEVIISSTMIRAHQTADILKEKIDVPVEYSELFVERRRPKEQIGHSQDNPGAILSGKEVWKNFTLSGYRFSDEENFDDLNTRARNALQHLGAMHEEHILVVTHGMFLRVLVARAMMGETLTAETMLRFMERFITSNAGMTVMTDDAFTHNNKKDPWRLLLWNDHTHLG